MINTDIDLFPSYIGGSEALINAIVADPTLEAFRVTVLVTSAWTPTSSIRSYGSRMHHGDEEELARDLGIGARGTLPVPDDPRPYPIGWRSWPWRRISLMSLALLGVIAVLIVGSFLM